MSSQSLMYLKVGLLRGNWILRFIFDLLLQGRVWPEEMNQKCREEGSISFPGSFLDLLLPECHDVCTFLHPGLSAILFLC